MSENKHPGYALPANDAVQNWFEENIDKECSASSAIYKFRLWLESLQPKPAGAVWVKGDYERLYEQLKADVNRRIVCYVDYDGFSRNDGSAPCRDICTIKGNRMEFSARGIGYGGAESWFDEKDKKEALLKYCERLNVEWLDESGAGGIDAIEFAEWCAFNYQRDFEPLDSSLPINEREYRQFWVDNDQTEYTTTDLYKLWQQLKSK